MKLDQEQFERIKSGVKKTEVRVNDEKRKKVEAGDTIVFSRRPKLREKIKVKVLGRKEVKNYPDLDKFYKKEEIDKFGFVIFNIDSI